MRYFNTSGPNIEKEHYTIQRTNLIEEGLNLVNNKRYFTIWAPRQTGKSTYFRQLAVKLLEQGYKVAHINFENYKDGLYKTFIERFKKKLFKFWNVKFKGTTIQEIFEQIENINSSNKFVLIIDEVEGINEEYFGSFLHSIRNAYHSREEHCLKSVILVGVSNIVGVVRDNASPFNIADNLNVPYFTNEEVYELLGQHERETGQLFDKKVKDKIIEITANQPGLVNGFAQQLVTRNKDKQLIDYEDYLKVEDWYLRIAIDKNFENIHSKAKQERSFVERLLFTEQQIPFDIDRPSIKLLHTNGLIKDDGEGFTSFYPYMNGEQKNIGRRIFEDEYFTESGELKFDKLMQTYKEYIKRRGFNPHREKDETGKYKSIKEAALIYSFETYIHALISELDGKIYREALAGRGKTDMIINVRGKEYAIETKIYYSPKRFTEGKKQIASYCKSLSLTKGIYLVFCPNDIRYPETVKEQAEIVDGVEIWSYIVKFDEEE